MKSISLLFVVFTLPLMVYYLLYISQCLPLDINPQIELYLTFVAYFSTLFLPFVTVISLPNGYCRNEWRKFADCIRKYRAKVKPTIIPTSNPVGLRRLETASKNNRLTLT